MIPVPGYEGRYSACEDGTIYSHLSHKSLHPRPLPNGYLRVSLCKGDGHPKDFLIHRVICSAFHGVNSEKHVNHIDLDKSNNRPENLEWCDRFENMTHASANGRLRAQSKRMTKLNLALKARPVCGVSPDKTALIFPSISEVGRHGFSYEMVRRCVNSEYEITIYKGYRWSLLKEADKNGD